MSDLASSRYRDALQRGHVAVVKGRPREAIGHYREAARLAPDRPLPHVRSGEVLLRMHEPAAALGAFDEALRRAPADVAALRGRAAALAASGRAEEARAVAARADELAAAGQAVEAEPPMVDPRPAEAEGHVANGMAARAAGDVGIAAAAFLAAARVYAGRDDFDAAIDACLRGLEARPGDIDIHFLMTVLYLRRGWIDLGVQRALLVEARLDIDDDRVRREALGAMARDFQAQAPELESLASATA